MIFLRKRALPIPWLRCHDLCISLSSICGPCLPSSAICERRPELLSSSMPMKRMPPGAAAMKLPVQQPGSSSVASERMRRRTRPSCMAAMTTGEGEKALKVVRFAESYSSGVSKPCSSSPSACQFAFLYVPLTGSGESIAPRRRNRRSEQVPAAHPAMVAAARARCVPGF